MKIATDELHDGDFGDAGEQDENLERRRRREERRNDHRQQAVLAQERHPPLHVIGLEALPHERLPARTRDVVDDETAGHRPERCGEGVIRAPLLVLRDHDR